MCRVSCSGSHHMGVSQVSGLLHPGVLRTVGGRGGGWTLPGGRQCSGLTPAQAPAQGALASASCCLHLAFLVDQKLDTTDTALLPLSPVPGPPARHPPKPVRPLGFEGSDIGQSQEEEALLPQEGDYRNPLHTAGGQDLSWGLGRLAGGPGPS